MIFKAVNTANKTMQKFRGQSIITIGIHKELKWMALRYNSVLTDLDFRANIFFLSVKINSNICAETEINLKFFEINKNKDVYF